MRTLVSKKCEQCNSEYFISSYKNKTSRFCSQKCLLEWKKIYVFPLHKAPWLSELNKQPGRNAKISRDFAEQRGINQRGQVRTHGRSYPKMNSKHIHRQVMEKFIGRKLEYSEVVHHIDGNNKNNDINNLMVMSRGEHSRLHHLGITRKGGDAI